MMDIPEEEKKYFDKFYVLYSKIIALQNFSQVDINYHKNNFNMIMELYEKGKYVEARQKMADTLMELQAMRSVEGFHNISFEKR